MYFDVGPRAQLKWQPKINLGISVLLDVRPQGIWDGLTFQCRSDWTTFLDYNVVQNRQMEGFD